MSLKAFHLFFIAVSTLLAFGFSVWCFYVYLTQSGAGYVAMGILSAASGVTLVLYGVHMYHKLRQVAYL